MLKNIKNGGYCIIAELRIDRFFCILSQSEKRVRKAIK